MSDTTKSESLFGNTNIPSKKGKSEALFSNNEIPSVLPQRSNDNSTLQNQSPNISSTQAAQNDYLFQEDLKKKLKTQMESMQREKEAGLKNQQEEGNNKTPSHFDPKENSLLDLANARRKRHYALNGDVKVYCYVKNDWPKITIKPLTIRFNDKLSIPPLGPFDQNKNEMLLEVVFNPLTLKIKRLIDPYVLEMNKHLQNYTINNDEYKKLAFYTCFKSWNIPVELPFENGRLAESAFDYIDTKIHPLLFDVVANEFLSLNEITDVEIEALSKQCERLFNKNNKSGISNAFEGIRLYCEASVFAKEFALSGKDLDDMSYRVASLIRYVSNKGSEIQAREFEADRHKSKKRAKVVGKGR